MMIFRNFLSRLLLSLSVNEFSAVKQHRFGKNCTHILLCHWTSSYAIVTLNKTQLWVLGLVANRSLADNSNAFTVHLFHTKPRKKTHLSTKIFQPQERTHTFIITQILSAFTKCQHIQFEMMLICFVNQTQRTVNSWLLLASHKCFPNKPTGMFLHYYTKDTLKHKLWWTISTAQLI